MDWIKWLDEEIDLLEQIFRHDKPNGKTMALDFNPGGGIHILYTEDLIEAAKQVGEGIDENEGLDPGWTIFSFDYKGYKVFSMVEHIDGGQNGTLQ